MKVFFKDGQMVEYPTGVVMGTNADGSLMFVIDASDEVVATLNVVDVARHERA